ncbi:hypothetical protein MBUL_02345 [Methylobacterium bullatum]|uniref:Uncharacterized protein n=1 Tax=Methylobacterium bullatum TaxID=570505 RepID=A0A679JAY6_9HYPH|nr:hypothetical protein MBUL_02345 [Methylobacterium bullatum]
MKLDNLNQTPCCTVNSISSEQIHILLPLLMFINKFNFIAVFAFIYIVQINLVHGGFQPAIYYVPPAIEPAFILIINPHRTGVPEEYSYSETSVLGFCGLRGMALANSDREFFSRANRLLGRANGSAGIALMVVVSLDSRVCCFNNCRDTVTAVNKSHDGLSHKPIRIIGGYRNFSLTDVKKGSESSFDCKRVDFISFASNINLVSEVDKSFPKQESTDQSEKERNSRDRNLEPANSKLQLGGDSATNRRGRGLLLGFQVFGLTLCGCFFASLAAFSFVSILDNPNRRRRRVAWAVAFLSFPMIFVFFGWAAFGSLQAWWDAGPFG